MVDRNSLMRALAGIGTAAPYQAELAVARDAAEAAGELLLEAFGTVTGRRKPDGSLVTDADLAADRLIASRLRAAFPADAVLSEEQDTVYGGAGRVWVVDPLDGTTNYCHRVPMWGVSLALVAEGEPVLGVSHFPSLRLSFWAVKGQGAWEGQRRLRTVAEGHLSAGDLVTFCSRMPRRYALQLEGKGRMLGSEALNLALVATGAAHLSLAATSHLWDLAAGWLLVAEAGGSLALLEGGAVWPLAAGDYAERTFATVAAGNLRLLAVARDRVHRRDDAPGA